MAVPGFKTMRGVCAALLVLAGAACSEAEGRGSPVEPEPGPGIHPTLVVTPLPSGESRVELVLRRVDVTEQVASVQGEITYDVTRMRLQAAEVPQGIAGAWNEVAPGRIRFAGLKVDGLGDGPVFTLRVQASAPLAAEAFSVTLSELIEAATFGDMTARVTRSPHPLFVVGQS
jgi:hypothetical protein